MELADDAGPDRGGLAGMEQVVGRPLEERLDLQRRVQRLDDPLGARPAALRDSGHVRLLLRKARAGQVDAGDLEERDVLGAQLAVPPRGLDKARQQASAQDGELGGEGLGERPGRRIRVVGAQGRRVRLGEPEADQDVLDAAPKLLHRRQRAEHRPPSGSVNGTSSSRKRATSSTTSTSRVTSRARNVGTTTSPLRRSKPSRSSQLVLLGGRRLEADQLVGALRPERDHRALGQLAFHVDVPDPLGAGRRDDQLGRELCRLLGQMRVDAFLPAVRALGAQAQAFGRAVEAGRLEVRGLEQDVGRPSPISVSSPPMIPAIATARSASAITRSDSSRRRSTPSSVRIVSPGFARRTMIFPPASVLRSNACSGFPSASMT